MTMRYDRALTVDELAREPDSTIDFSDMPELDDGFFQEASILNPDGTRTVRLRIKEAVLQAFKATGDDYPDAMATALEAYARAHLKVQGAA